MAMDSKLCDFLISHIIIFPHALESNIGYRSLIMLKDNVLYYSHTQYQIKIIYLNNVGKIICDRYRT